MTARAALSLFSAMRRLGRRRGAAWSPVKQFGIGLSAVAVLFSAVLQAQPADSPGTSPSLRFRQVLVPESEIPKQVQQGLMPLRRERFDEIIGQINRRVAGSTGPGELRTVRGEYQASLGADGVLVGQGKLDLVHGGEVAEALVLAPCNLALTRAQWVGDAAASATLGTDVSGRTVVIVDRNGTLQFDWSLASLVSGKGQLRFAVELPASPRNEMTLDLPLEWIAESSAGLLTPLDAPAEKADASPGARTHATRKWLWQLGGIQSAELRLVSDASSVRSLQVVLARQDSHYRFTNAGLEYQSDIRLDVHHRPLKWLALDLDPPLTVVNARLGDRQLSIRSDPSAASGTRLRVDFPDELEGVSRELAITAFAPLVTDTAWRLPSVRPVGVVWQQGTATLEVPGSLVLKRIVPGDAVETAVGALPPARGGESRSLLLYKPDAAIDVTLSLAPARIALMTGTTLHLSPALMTGQLRANVSGAEGGLFALEAQVRNGWIVDRVEAVPADALEPIAPWILRDRKLRVRLRAGISTSRPLQLLVYAHRRVSNLPLAGGEFRMLSFENVQRERSLMCVCPDAPYHLLVSRNADVARLRADELSAEDRSLVDVSEGSLAYEDRGTAQEFMLGLNFEAPRYAASIAQRASFTAQNLRETYRIRIEPAGSQVSRVLVHFSEASDRDTSWRLLTGARTTVSARRLPETEGGSGEMWEVGLLTPVGEMFEIEAARSRAAAVQQRLSLASLPEASSQSATVTVDTLDAAALTYQTENVKSIPVASPADGAYAHERAAWRYDPARNAVVSVSRPTDRTRAESAWVWDATLMSRYDPAGDALHIVQYHVENTGRTRFSVSLPRAVHEWRVSVDDVELPSQRTGATAQRLAIPLPSDVRYPTVRVSFTLPGKSLGLKSEMTAPWPEIDLPCLAWNWSVWLPPSFSADEAATDSDPSGFGMGDDSLGQRWLGFSVARGGTPPFDAFSRQEWRQISWWWERTAVSRRTADDFSSLVEAACRDLMSASENEKEQEKEPPATWGELFTRVVRRAGQDRGRHRWTLLIDSSALRAAGINSATPLSIRDGVGAELAADARTRSSRYGSNRAGSLLSGSPVAVAVWPDQVVVTNINALSRWSRFAVPTDTPRVVAIDATRKTPPESQGPDDGFLSAAAWAASREPEKFPWRFAAETELLHLPATGWIHTPVGGESGAASLHIYNRSLFELGGWAATLACLGGACWLLRARPMWHLVFMAAAALAAACCDASWIPVARGCLWGLVLGGLVLRIRAVPAAVRQTVSSDDSTIVSEFPATGAVTLAVWLCCLLALATATASLHGGEPVMPAAPMPSAPGPVSPMPTSPPAVQAPPSVPANVSAPPSSTGPAVGSVPAGNTGQMAVPGQPPGTRVDSTAAGEARLGGVFEILSPVGEDRQPTGNYVYLPRAFYDMLYRMSGERPVAPRAWLIQSATYSLVPKPNRESAGGDRQIDVSAEYEVELFDPAARVLLPMKREDATMVEATVDGHPVPITWEADGLSLEPRVELPRRVRMTLLMHPRIRHDENLSQFSLAIPPILRARARVSEASLLPGVEIPSARGQIRRNAPGNELDVELGPTDRLAVRWHLATERASLPVDAGVTSLLLMRVQPNAVTVDARFDLRIRDGELRELSLVADPRLRLLPFPAGSPVIREEIQSGQVQKIRLELDRPYTNSLTVRASFLCAETGGLGVLNPPLLAPEGCTLDASWLALSLTPGLQLQTKNGDATSSKQLAEFASLWGSPEPLLQFAARVANDSPLSQVTVQASRPRTEARQAMDLSVGVSQSTLLFRAVMTMRDGAYFEQRLSVPPQLVLQELKVTRDGINHAQRWAVDGNGTLTVFFTEPLTGEHQLTLQGEMPTPSVLPVVSLQAAEIADYQIKVFRRPAAAVAVSGLGPGMQQAEAKAGQYDSVLGRFVVAMKIAGGPQSTAQIKLDVTPNRPDVRGQLVTSLVFRENRWTADAELTLRVARGELDSFRISIPDKLAEPFQLEPSLPFEVIPSLEPRRRVIVVRPLQAIQGLFRFRLKSTLKGTAGEPMRAPDLRVPDVEDLRRFLVLPTRLETQQVTWQTSGLRVATLDEGSHQPPIDPAAQTVFQAVSQNPEAVVRDTERIAGAPRVHLADISVVWSADLSYRAVATYDLEPARLAELECVMPQQSALLQVFVAELPVTAQSLNGRRWRIPLGPEQWPQRVALIYRGTLERGRAGQMEFASPEITGLSISRTLWTISSSREAGIGRPETGQAVVDRLEQFRIRVESAQALADAAPAVVAQDAAQEAAIWQRIWRRHVEDARRHYQGAQTLAAASNSAALRTASQFDTPPAGTPAELRTGRLPVDPAQVLQWTDFADGNTLRLAFRGAQADVRVDYADALRPVWIRLTLVIVLVTLAVLSWQLARSAICVEFCGRWPFALAALAGLIWWLFFAPSVLGLAVLVLSAVASFRTAGSFLPR